MDVPKTRYAKSGDVHVAYQVVGEGPLDLVFVPGFVSHLEFDWEVPGIARFLQRLASFSRLIRFDKRGTGLSDRPPGVPTLEQRMDDVRTVMDAVGSEKAALLGISEGGPMSLLFAATYPQRTSALILYGSYARRAWAPDHPFGKTAAEMDRVLEALERDWGGGAAIDIWAPSKLADERFTQLRANYLRLAASPGAAVAIIRMNMEIDVRHILPAIRVPTLVIHRTGDRLTHVEQARYMAEHIVGANLVELPGIDHTPYVDGDPILDEVEEFLTGVRHRAEPDRVLATVLFTDIVGSTERAAELGDRGWRDLLQSHHALVRRELARFRGREIDTAGDGFLATFDGPARAIRCAGAISDAVRQLGIEIRAGLHTGECEIMGDRIGGIAVHIGARVAAMAAPGEVLVSSTVKDLVAGSGLEFEDRGTHTLKGIPGEWRLFAVRRAHGDR
ncbi:MAG: adenylate/guanylate cyclase domain-containing protein [Candidatus Rokubacteria bacterium]|nr:adenylate/guanylate cyclase domain-containing protein [Candidatus Rokubacteria bacterium]MBI2553714.1 adenylate/guanylate cyclase domain-containing protein [Candidatus Rokubacteria bacterium]